MTNLSNIELSSQRHLLKKYVAGRCYRPVRVRYFDVDTETFQERYVPCGKCLHCVSRYQQDWVTRMSLQSMHSKYTYFVTLTFSPEFLAQNTKYQELLCCISYNGEFLPLLLSKKPLQDFFKRLRFNTQRKLQYYACGEYGDTYGRPHYHFVLWSDDEFCADDISKAWSLDGQLIGRIQFDNLRLNGTLNDLFREDDSASMSGDNISSKSCFKYVAKYCTKFHRNIDNIPTIKLIQKYYDENIKGKTFNRRFNISNCPCGNYSYETWREFVHEFSPFVVCSTKYIISGEYFRQHIEEWSHEVPDKIESFGHEYSTPKCARKMWRNRVYPYRVASVKNENKISIANPMAMLRSLIFANNIFSDYNSSGIIKDGVLHISHDLQFYNLVTKEHIFIDARSGMFSTYEFRRSFGYVYTGSYSISNFVYDYSQSVVNYISLIRQDKVRNGKYITEQLKDLDAFLSNNNISYEQFTELTQQIVQELQDEFVVRQDKYLKQKVFKNKYNKLLS